ncbi:hypothetical protein [Bradyrhizobium sp. 145]|uniref:hypothetical protein n=1 Tax=Bradyrhizobium sp. 145 TaxID=2782621 RepID=UPI001FF8B9D0|nr:hypothetical protein [Bradyrhizobium sp. 145]MCK1684662.1 hypothetical protein [Bradyrhizobium sp. 145]
MTGTLNQQNTPGAQVWSVSRDALELCYRGYALLNDTESALKEANPQTRLVNGRPTIVVENTKEFAAATEAAWKRMAPLIDGKVKQLRGCMTLLAERVATALEDPKRKSPEGLSHASEVRAYVKALPEEKRTAFIFQAISEGDRATVASVLHAQPFLSGLTADAQALIRQQAAAKFAPQDHAQHQAAATALEYVMEAGTKVGVRYGALSRSMRLSPAEKAAEKLKMLAGG